MSRSIRINCDLAITPILPPRFRQAATRHTASEAYRRFQTDPSHPGLQFKPLHSTLPLWSARVTDSYRAVGVRRDDTIVWFFIGTHAEYDRMLAKLA